MASMIFQCTVCEAERSIPLAVVPRNGLQFDEEIDHPCWNCFLKGLVVDPAQKRRFVSTRIFVDGLGDPIEMIISNYFN